MRDHFDPLFPGEPPHVRRVPGSPVSGRFLADTVLETLLNSLEHASSETGYGLQLSFYEKLLTCDLLLPVPVGTQLSDGLPLMTLENPRGEVGLPLFTNETNLAEWEDEPTEYVILSFPRLCGYAIEAQVDFIIINVAGPHGCEIAMRDFSYLAESLLPPPVLLPPADPSKLSATPDPQPSSLPVQIKAGTPARLALGKSLPDELMGQLGHLFSTHQALIDRVYQFEIAFNEGPLQPALGVMLKPEMQLDWETRLLPNVKAVLCEMMEPRTVMNVFQLNQVPSLAKQVYTLCEPLFVGSPTAEAAESDT